jgi:hypothetical protein
LEKLNNLHQSSQGSFHKMILPSSPTHLPHVHPLVLFNPIGILDGVNNLVTFDII